MTGRRRPAGGMTLVESLLAVALLGGVLLGAAWVLQTSRLDVEDSRRRGVAMREAWSLLDRVGAAGRAGWRDLAGPGRCPSAASACRLESAAAVPGAPLGVWHSRLAGALPAATGTLELQALEGTLADARVVRASVEVSWRGRRRVRRIVLTEVLR